MHDRLSIEPNTRPKSVPTRLGWQRGPDSGFDPELAAELALADYPTRVEVTSPEEAFDALSGLMRDADREVCVALMLDTKHRLIERTIVSAGSIDHTFMGPRELLRDALKANANAMIIAHNHPSGDPTPSQDDELVTRRISEAGKIVGVDLLDHVVIGGARWVSLARKGVC